MSHFPSGSLSIKVGPGPLRDAEFLPSPEPGAWSPEEPTKTSSVESRDLKERRPLLPKRDCRVPTSSSHETGHSLPAAGLQRPALAPEQEGSMDIWKLGTLQQVPANPPGKQDEIPFSDFLF